MNNLLSGKALVTGATGSIGREIVRSLHDLGIHVCISGSNEEKLRSLGDELKSNYTIKLCDLSNKQDVLKLVSSIDELDIMVCNAGIVEDSLAIKMTEESFNKVIDINLKASFILNREAIKKMIRRRYGRIVNISSVVAISGNVGQANYCAAKAGLIGMSKSLACEVANRGITVNVVAPGFIQSNMTDFLNQKYKDRIIEKIPMKVLGHPRDVAYAVKFLVNPLSSYITGHTLHVNGGMLMI